MPDERSTPQSKPVSKKPKSGSANSAKLQQLRTFYNDLAKAKANASGERAPAQAEAKVELSGKTPDLKTDQKPAPVPVPKKKEGVEKTVVPSVNKEGEGEATVKEENDLIIEPGPNNEEVVGSTEQEIPTHNGRPTADERNKSLSEIEKAYDKKTKDEEEAEKQISLPSTAEGDGVEEKAEEEKGPISLEEIPETDFERKRSLTDGSKKETTTDDGSPMTKEVSTDEEEPANLEPQPDRIEETQPVVEENTIESIDRKINRKQQVIEELDEKIEPLAQKIKGLEQQLQQAQRDVQPIVTEQEELEKRIRQIEQEEVSVSGEKRHALESERWKLEQKLHELKQQHWRSLESHTNLDDSIDATKQDIGYIEEQKQELADEIKMLKEEKRGRQLIAELEEITAKKRTLEDGWIELNKKRGEMNDRLAPLNAQELHLENEKKEVLLIEQKASDSSARAEAERKRWKLEQQRHDVEQQRWELQQQLEGIELKIERLKPEYRQLENEEDQINAELDTIQPERVL